eukprot:766806-Hanusia_phi.AAC.9
MRSRNCPPASSTSLTRWRRDEMGAQPEMLRGAAGATGRLLRTGCERSGEEGEGGAGDQEGPTSPGRDQDRNESSLTSRAGAEDLRDSRQPAEEEGGD